MHAHVQKTDAAANAAAAAAAAAAVVAAAAVADRETGAQQEGGLVVTVLRGPGRGTGADPYSLKDGDQRLACLAARVWCECMPLHLNCPSKCAVCTGNVTLIPASWLRVKSRLVRLGLGVKSFR